MNNLKAHLRAPDSAAAGLADPAELSLELRSNPLYLSAAREMVAAVAKRLGFADEAAGQMALAVDEALCNVIRHGYNREPNRPIWIRVYPEGNGWGSPLASGGGGGSAAPMPVLPQGQLPATLRIVIEDEARQVDPAIIKSRDLEEVRPGGLGVHIIQTVMDEVRYEHRPVAGMRLTMIKNRREASADSAAAVSKALSGREPTVDSCRRDDSTH